jgi:hypothetical protein
VLLGYPKPKESSPFKGVQRLLGVLGVPVHGLCPRGQFPGSDVGDALLPFLLLLG